MKTMREQEKRASWIILGIAAAAISLSMLSGCGGADNGPAASNPLPPIDTPLPDNTVVHGQAVVFVSSTQETALFKLFNSLMPSAYASTGSVVVTYNNSASTNFTINANSLVAGAFTGNTLSLGSVSLATLDDNNLKVCNPGGNSKCTSAIIRVYNTGSLAGFVNTADSYAAPVYAGTLNPSTALGLNSAGAVQVQTASISGSTHRLTISSFPSPTYNVTSDFSNAGAGSYSMTFVVEYALAP